MTVSRLRVEKRWQLWLAILVVAGLAVPLAAWIQKAPASGAEVHGYVVADFGPRPHTSNLFYLPDITVYVRNLDTGIKSVQVQTDRKGFFIVPHQPPGSYEVCAEAPGYNPVCPERFTIQNDVVYLPPVPIPPKGRYVLGTVRMEDSRSCGFADRVFGVQFSTLVTALDVNSGLPLAPAVRANVAGEYLVPQVNADLLILQAECEAVSTEQPVTLGGSFAIANLELKNSSPKGLIITAWDGGNAVRQAPPGSRLEMTTEGEDADLLTFQWRVSGGTLSASTGDRVDWTLPDQPGVYSVYVLAQDRRGGVTVSRRDISTQQGVLFTGTVVGGGIPLEKAVVDVNGTAAVTNPAGSFAVVVPDEGSRYVLNIRKEGFQVFSKVLTAPVTGRTFRLAPAQRFVFDAGQGVRMTERRECRPLEPQENRPLGGSPCGAEVIIPAGSLVDGNGQPVAGTVNGYMASIDLRDPQSNFPGEYAGSNRAGREVGLNSLGAVDVQLTDLSGNPVNLAPGSSALVRIPVDDLQLGMPEMPVSPPATVPIWFYDPKSGIWVEEGDAQLVGGFYEARVRHFSTINADLEFTSPACVRVITQAPLAVPYQLRVSIPAVSPVKILTDTIADPLSVIVRLPAGTPIKLEVLDSAGQVIQASTQTHTTGASSSPDFPADPYGSCTSQVTMTLGLPTNGGFLDYFTNSEEEADEYYSKIDPVAAPGAGTVQSSGTTITGTGTSFSTFFQAGHILRAAGQVRLIASVSSNTSLVTSSAFSPALPPGTPFERVGVKPTLADWKTANDLNTFDQEAVYENAADLGFGRWMRMKKKINGDIAYYVTNYGSVDAAALAWQGVPVPPGATVAMEYSAAPGDPVTSRYTKFYVFGAGGNRINQVDLDGNGNKMIPMLCVICHSGNASLPSGDAKGDLQARFIGFDPESFKYTGLEPLLTQPNQETEFKELNRGIRNDTNVTPATLELINGWYGGPALPLGSQTATFAPAAWTAPGKSSLYNQVVKPSCRACHATRIGRVSWDSWDPPGAFDGFKESGPGIEALVCNARIMPQAKVTFKNFWLSTSPHRPAALANGGLDGWAPGDPCPTP